METPETQQPPAPVTPPAEESFTEPARKTQLWPAVGARYHWAIILTLGTIVLLTYANSFTTGFALDNKFIILEDPRLRAATKENVKAIFREDYWWPKAVSGLYRPLTTLSYLFNYSILGNGDRSTGYHWINFCLHWANAVLVYFLVLVLMEKLWPAFFVAALFGTHPIATESVTNIIGRADLFATLAILGGFLCYAKSTVVAGWRKIPWLVALGVVTLLGVFCKESAVAVLGVVMLYDFTYRIERKHPHWLPNLVMNFWEWTWKGYVAMIVPLAGWWFVRSHVFERLRPPELPWVDNPLVMPGVDFWTARLTAIKVIGKYFALLLWPQTLSCDYSYNQIPIVSWHFNTWEDWKALIALAVIIVALVVAIRQYHRNKAVFFFTAFFFGTFFPTSNLTKIIGSIMAERFMYTPSIGFVGCVVIAAYATCRRLIPKLDVSEWAQRIWLQVVARSALCLVVMGYGTRAFIRNFDWNDDERLWSAAVAAVPDSFKSHKSLAYALYEKDPEGKNIDRIIEEGEKALAVTDKTQIVLLHLGAYYRIKGDTLAQRAPDGSLIPTPASLPWYQKSVDVLQRAAPLDHEFNDDNRRKELKRGRKPETIQDIGNHEIYWNLGLSLMRLGQHQAAFDAYVYMRHLSPTNPDSYLSIASALLAMGRIEDTAITLLQALLIDSNRQEALRLVIDIYRQVDREGCAVVFSQNQPRLNADCALVRNHICTAYAGLAQVFIETRQPTLAQQTIENAIASYRCAPETFQNVGTVQAASASKP
jgi:tetratricopeptide (TPR) repeat protein